MSPNRRLSLSEYLLYFRRPLSRRRIPSIDGELLVYLQANVRVPWPKRSPISVNSMARSKHGMVTRFEQRKKGLLLFYSMCSASSALHALPTSFAITWDVLHGVFLANQPT
ncbi:hypothetical protein BKA70DRAFT_1385999 [Coprinopsis sp. MPI-PUGE-AT-0042]|nr:hypothetical protein BKA70DRAFT_1385999 [Coprinopsis sp. MPI-PUGE-AT-0042]